MPKHSRNKAPKRLSGDIRLLMLNLVQDLYVYLPGADALISCITRNGGASTPVRELVSAQLADAESSLHSVSIETYAALRQVDAFLKKNVDGAGHPSLRKERALAKFAKTESTCKRINRKLAHFRMHPSRMPGDLSEVFSLARQEVFSLLGAFDGDDLEACLEGCGFGPGLTYGARDPDHAHLYYKVGGEPLTGTSGTREFMGLLREVFPRWFSSLEERNVMFQEVPGNRLTVVPKTAVIDRVIAIEPSLNVFLQKGVESVLRRYLLRWGVTIRDQSRNYVPAHQGSIDGSFATIDLSSASDCVSTELVRWFLPPGWYRFLDAMRCKSFTTDKGETWQEYHKFSSMGNATTFPLECLIFMALARAVCKVTGTPMDGVRVYGDDIIIPMDGALLLIQALSFCGFSVNREKTFVFGPFRESCGVDYLSGIDVRPVYLKRSPRSEGEVYNLFNRLRRNRFGFRFPLTLRYLWDLVPRPCLCPSDLGAGDRFDKWYAGKASVPDAGFHVPRDYVRRIGRYSRPLQCVAYRTEILQSRLRTTNEGFCEELRYLVFLLGVEGGEIQFARTRVTYRVYRSFTVWDDVGWWPDWLTCG